MNIKGDSFLDVNNIIKFKQRKYPIPQKVNDEKLLDKVVLAISLGACLREDSLFQLV
jgi:hypothetical protein